MKQSKIKKMIEKKMNQQIVLWIPRTAMNGKMIARLENGIVLEASSHIEMKRILERPREKGLLD